MYSPRTNDVKIRSSISLVNVSLSAGATIVQPTSTVANPSPWPSGTFSLAYGTLQLTNEGSNDFPLNSHYPILQAIKTQGRKDVKFISNRMIIDKWAGKIRLLIEVDFVSTNSA
jgi:hypothetical protein